MKNARQFDLNLLVALDALLTERNVTRAGERLHLSQSAMSGILSRLRLRLTLMSSPILSAPCETVYCAMCRCPFLS